MNYAEDDEETSVATKLVAPKTGHVSIHSSGFRDFLLKPELLRSIVECGFEHPSEGNKMTNDSFCNDNKDIKNVRLNTHTIIHFVNDDSSFSATRMYPQSYYRC